MCIFDLKERLFAVAMKNSRNNRELSEEAVLDTMLSCIEKGRDDFNYAAVCVKNYLREQFNKAKRQKTESMERFRDEETGEFFGPALGITFPNQDRHMFVGDCVRGIEQLSDRVRPVMEKVAQDWTAAEIAEHLRLPKTEVESLTKYARKIMRGMAAYGVEAKTRGHSKYIGIYRRHRIWEASARKGEDYYYLGHFATASEAAIAYDKKAKELFGTDATLNFPDSIEAPKLAAHGKPEVQANISKPLP